uniref:Serine/threonine-protein phosphatase 4 regulatory subunit 3-like central domain-containing protein n=1 Tax=Odontella aurita TaxID=265563 RepID=A0A6U6CC54_9STRA
MASNPGSGGGFDWLSNGLFGRGKANDGQIENSTDVPALYSGIVTDFRELTVSGGKEGHGEGDGAGGEASENATVSASSQGPGASNLGDRLSRIKYLLYNERTSPAQRGQPAPAVAAAVCEGLTKDHLSLLPSFLGKMQSLPFEARKDVAAIFNYLLVCGCPEDDGESDMAWQRYYPVMMEFVRFLRDVSVFTNVATPIIMGHDCTAGPNGVPAAKNSPDVALHCGSMLRSMLRHPSLFKLVVSEEYACELFFPFLDSYVHQPNFEVASDALETVRVIFTGGDGALTGSNTAPVAEGDETMEEMASAFLQRNYDSVIEERFNQKMLSGSASYVTKRASVQLLSTILLTRSNYAVMMKYISSRSNLRIIMCLLRDPSPHITFLAFQVFKIFVANPEKPQDIVRILVDNKTKLIRYLDGLHREREECDEQFRDEKSLVIATLEGLEL